MTAMAGSSDNPFLTPEGIARIAVLARLRVPPAELPAWADQMRKIVVHVDRLREIPDELLPDPAPPFETPIRADAPSAGDGARELERNAGRRAHNHVVVPRVVEAGS
jgi:aspartyl/glutamyl-tRNA(Asn/Gln) amidotransferase C subunit